MTEEKIRVLMLCSHPTQYGSPMWRRFSGNPKLDASVAYCSLQGAEAYMDPGFGVELAWDVPLLEGYRWVAIKNFSPRPSINGLFGLINPGVWKLIRSGRFDAVAIFTGYRCITFWIALVAAKMSGIPVLYGTDATGLHPMVGSARKASLKKRLWPRLFRLADMVIVPSSATAAMMRSLQIPEERIKLTPYVVDNSWWAERAGSADRASLRARWNIPQHARVVLFCAKLQPWKRPQDLLRAFARAAAPNSYLVYAGDGPLRQQLESEAKELGLDGRIRFLGFVNQSALPEVYCCTDVMVLPSVYEPFGVVVNEAMLCGCPVIVSDQVGARVDLVQEGKTGFSYPVGDVGALATVLSEALKCPDRLRQMGEAGRARMARWSPEMNVQATIEAVELAIQHSKSA